MYGIFDLVTNNGTGEHIFNQASVFEWAHALCKPGGMMLHVLPWTGYLNHGFFSYHPVLFRDLAGANDYEIVALYAGERNGTLKKLDESGYHHPRPHKEPLTVVENVIRGFGDRANVFVVALMRKKTDSPFVYPTQGKYEADFETYQAAKDLSEVPSILDHDNIVVKTDPFPHVIIDNALPEEFYNRLSETFPDWKSFTPEDAVPGTLHHIKAAKAIYDGGLDPAWRRFILKHVEPAFATAFIELFGDHVEPLMASLGKKDLTLGVRGTGEFDLVTDCQIAINVPGDMETLTRGAHLDSPDEIVAGLLYVPVPGDEAGGDLKLYRWLESMAIEGKAEACASLVEEVCTIPYRPNQLILFANTIHSLHGLAPRKPCTVPRRYVNFVVNASNPVREEPPRNE